MKTQPQIISIFIAAILLISLTACTTTGVDTPDQNLTSSDNTDVQSVSQQPEKVEIGIFTQQLRENIDKDSRVKAFYDSIDRFVAANPNVEITVDAIATEPYNDKAKILAAANELPEVFEVLGSWNKNFVESGVSMNLTDIINADPDFKAVIKPTAIGNYTIGDGIYGICLEEGGSTTLLFYNEDILKECGVNAPPQTMTELKESIEAIRAKEYTPISLGNKGPWVAESCYLSAIGSRYTGNEWNFSIVNNSGAKFTDPEFIKGLALMQELAEIGAFNSDFNSIDYQQQRVPYYNKEAAMFIEGYWAINSLNSDCPEDVLLATHVAPIPLIEDAKVPDYLAGGNGGWAFSLNSSLDGATKDAAVGWLKTLISRESASGVLEGGNPCAIVPGDYDKTKISRLHQEFFNLMDETTFCETYDLIFSANVIDVMNRGLQDLLINTISPEELGQRIQTEYEKTEE